MGASWLVTHIIKYYRFTGDEAVLMEVFDILKATAQFALDFLTSQLGNAAYVTLGSAAIGSFSSTNRTKIAIPGVYLKIRKGGPYKITLG